MKTLGYSSCCSALTTTSYPVTFCRFLRRMLMTSEAVQPPAARRTSSTGVGPVFPSRASMTSASLEPDWATHCLPSPCTVANLSLPVSIARLLWVFSLIRFRLSFLGRIAKGSFELFDCPLQPRLNQALEFALIRPRLNGLHGVTGFGQRDVVAGDPLFSAFNRYKPHQYALVAGKDFVGNGEIEACRRIQKHGCRSPGCPA